ncbi:MAG: hypothetical protein II306_08635, partial [Clostridia bacterium]|nr:hypothetical protein [Clostridia bacterium]
DYFQENANREYLELYEEFIYGIPGDYADNYNVVQKAFVSEENLDAVESVPADRIPIYTEAELNKIGKSAEYPLDGNYILMRDIELKYDFGGIGYTSDRTIEPFTGDFDGNGHTIYDLNPVVRYNGTTEVYMGFILYNKGKVYNLRFLDSNDDCREAEKTTASIKSSVANSATAYLGLVVGRNEAEENTSNIYNIYVDNATFIIKNAPWTTYCGLVAGHLGESFVTDVTVVNSHLDVAGTVTPGAYYVGGVSGYAVNGGGMISHNNFVKCDKDSLVGGCIGYYDSTDETRKDTYAYENDVQSTFTSNRQLAGSDNLNAYTFGGADKHALTNEKVFKYYCDNDELVGGLGGYAEEWKEHSETESKPWLIVHAPDGMTAYQNSLISMKNLKVYFAQYGDDTSVYEDVTDRVNFIYDFSEIAEDVPVTVVYGKHLVEFTVDVVEPVVTDIAITNKGKTQFRVGEKFDNSLFAGQVLYSNNLTDSLGATDEGLKVYIPELEGDNPIDVGAYKFIETSTGTDVVVEYKGYRATYQISVLPEDLTGKLHFSSSSVETAPGGTFDVVINLNNNPGIVALSTFIEYDNDLFEVLDVIDGGLLDSFNEFTDYTPSVPLLWMGDKQATEDNKNTDNKLVTVKFKVKEGNYDADTYGMHILRCVNGEAVNKAGETITIPDMVVKVKLNETAIGDVNSNNAINSWDAVLLTQYIFNIPNGINILAADINRDGSVNSLDSTNLNRYIVGLFGLTGAPGKFDVRVKSEYFDDEILTGLVVNNILPQPEEKFGYIFGGYYSDADYTNKIERLPAQSVREMVVYAKYSVGYVIESDIELVNNIHVPGVDTQLECEEDKYALWNVYSGES